MEYLTRRVLTGLAVGALALALSAGVSAAEFTIRAASHYNADTAIGFGMKTFKRLVEEYTNGRVEVELFLNAELGGEREHVEMVKNGAIEMTSTGLSGVGLYVSGLEVLELPYLYKDVDSLVRITSALIPSMQKMLNEKGFHSVGFIYNGPRSTIATRPLRTLEDFKNLKIRVPEAPLYVGWAKTMGAKPTPVPWPEIYTSLQTGLVEATEAAADGIYSSRFYEVAKYFTKTEHIYFAQYLVFNTKYFNALPADIQEAVMQAGHDMGPLQAQENKRVVDKALAALKKNGTEIIELTPTETQKFRDAMLDFNEEFAKSLGEAPYGVFKEAMRLIAEGK